MIEQTKFRFKSYWKHYEKELLDIKNNTVREIDLTDERFTNLIAWMETGWNDGDIKIRIQRQDDDKTFFERDIRDISIWDDLMIITWNSESKINP